MRTTGLLLALVLVGCGSSKLSGGNSLTGDLAFPVGTISTGEGGGCNGFTGPAVFIDEYCLGGRSLVLSLATPDGGVVPGTYPIDDGSKSTCGQGFQASAGYGELPRGGGSGWVVGARSGTLTIDAVELDPSGFELMRGSFDLSGFQLPDGGTRSVRGDFDATHPIYCLADGGP